MHHQKRKIEGIPAEKYIQNSTLWKYEDLAKFLNVSVHKLRHDVLHRRIPFMKIAGRSVRFDPKAIQKWLEESTIQPK